MDRSGSPHAVTPGIEALKGVGQPVIESIHVLAHELEMAAQAYGRSCNILAIPKVEDVAVVQQDVFRVMEPTHPLKVDRFAFLERLFCRILAPGCCGKGVLPLLTSRVWAEIKAMHLWNCKGGRFSWRCIQQRDGKPWPTACSLYEPPSCLALPHPITLRADAHQVPSISRRVLERKAGWGTYTCHMCSY